MVNALLASTDPMGAVAAGGTPDAYHGLAVQVVYALRHGAVAEDLLGLLRSDAAGVESAHAFSRAAHTWWVIDASRRGLATAV